MAAVAVDELGPICSKNGITSSMLLMYPLNHVRLPEVETIKYDGWLRYICTGRVIQ